MSVTGTAHAQTRALANVVQCATRLPAGSTSCVKFPVRRATHPEVGHWTRTHTETRQGIAYRISTQYPILVRRTPPAPPTVPMSGGYWANYEITGYSVCDTPGSYMADGTPVTSQAGMAGAAATYLGFPGGLPFGTHVYIPSLHRLVTVHDRGSYAYFTVPHIDVYTGRDCTIFSNLAGLGTHNENVYISR